MTVNYYPGNLQWLGLAKESVEGTAMSAPTMWIPTDSPKWVPKITSLVDQNLRGMMGTDYGATQGMRYDEITYKTYLYADSVFPHIAAILGGSDTVTGAADPYTHTMSLYNGSGTDNAQPHSYTAFLYLQGGKCVSVPGCKISEVKVTIKANELPSLDVTWDGLSGSFIAAPTNTPSTDQPFPPFTTSISVGGSDLSKYSDIEIDLKRDTEAIPILSGSADPLGIYSGALSVSGTLGAVYQGTTDTDLANFIANDQPAIVVSIYPEDSSTHPLTLTMSKVSYTDSAPEGSDSWMTISSSFTALMNGTDATDSKLSPIKAEFVTATETTF